ncbi:MAG: AMP-binding protein [Geodermatophilaceae bacterium]
MPNSLANVADLVRAAAQRDPDHLALAAVPASPDEPTTTLTWSELDQRVDDVACALAGRGLSQGDRVVLRMANTLHFPIAYFAVLRAGLVAVPCNPAYTAREINHILTDSGARLMLTAQNVPAPAGLAEHPISVEVLSQLPLGDNPLETASDSVGGDEDLAVLMYTSGTTGAPKGAMLPHRALLANLEQCLALRPTPMTQSDVVLLVLPLFHIYGLNAALGMIARTGATGILMERFDPEASLSLIIEHRVTNIPGAPPLYLAWLDRTEHGQLTRAFSNVRLATSGAAPLPPEVLNRMAKEFGVDVFEGYGLTETAPVLTSSLTTGRVKAGSIGQAIPDLELRLVDDGAGPIVAPRDVRGAEAGDQADDELGHAGDPDDPFDDPSEDGAGEIHVRGANVFLGYWPDARGGPDADGWFSTGDVAYRDAEGDLHLIDRRRDLILVSGFNVYPREVELVLAAHPQIAEAAVLGVKDAVTGNGVRAILVLARDAVLSKAEVSAYAAIRLARFKCPTSIEFVAELPHSVTGKVSKARLRELGFADIRTGPV